MIPIDAKGRRSLSKMVSSNDRSSVVLFTVVSEPSEEEEDGVCVDVGVAEIDLGSVAREVPNSPASWISICVSVLQFAAIVERSEKSTILLDWHFNLQF